MKVAALSISRSDSWKKCRVTAQYAGSRKDESQAESVLPGEGAGRRSSTRDIASSLRRSINRRIHHLISTSVFLNRTSLHVGHVSCP